MKDRFMTIGFIFGSFFSIIATFINFLLIMNKMMSHILVDLLMDL